MRGALQMTERQAAFVRCFCDPDNATTFDKAKASALAAGYAPSAASATGAKLKQHPAVQAAIKKLRDAASESVQFSIELAIEAALGQANAWLDEDGNPLREPTLHRGEIVRDMFGRPLQKQWRPDNANVAALTLAARLAGFLESDAPSVTTQVGVLMVPVSGADEEWTRAAQKQQRELAARVATTPSRN